MAQLFDIHQLMVNDDVQDSACVNALLRDIHSILVEREQLVKHIDFDLNRRGTKDQKRLAKLLSYSGPDRDTLVLLGDHAEQWFDDPSLFWTRSRPHDLSGLPAAAQIIEWQKSFGSVNGTLAVIAPFLKRYFGHDESQLSTTIEHLTATVTRMIGIGSRYKNLEASLSAGVTLCLGTSVSESSWSKFLPKSGAKFDAMVARIRSTDVGDLAPKHAQLRAKLVSYRMESLLSTTTVPQLPLPSREGRHGEPHYRHVPCISANDDVILEALDPMLLWTVNSDYDITQTPLARTD